MLGNIWYAARSGVAGKYEIRQASPIDALNKAVPTARQDFQGYIGGWKATQSRSDMQGLHPTFRSFQSMKTLLCINCWSGTGIAVFFAVPFSNRHKNWQFEECCQSVFHNGAPVVTAPGEVRHHKERVYCREKGTSPQRIRLASESLGIEHRKAVRELRATGKPSQVECICLPYAPGTQFFHQPEQRQICTPLSDNLLIVRPCWLRK